MTIWNLSQSINNHTFASVNLEPTIKRWLGSSTVEITFSLVLLFLCGYVLYIFVFQPLWRLLSGIINFYRLKNVEKVFLEITSPHTPEKSPYATQQLFVVIEDYLAKRSGRSGVKDVLSLEIVSTKQEGIRYLMCVRKSKANNLKDHIISYLPDAKVQILDAGYMTTGERTGLVEYKQQRHYAYPLQQQEDLIQSDVIAYIAGSMNKLEQDEAIVMQIVIAPHYSRWTMRLNNKILNKGYADLDHKFRIFFMNRLWVWAIGFVCMLFDVQFGLAVIVILLIVDYFLGLRESEPELSVPMQKIYEQILAKLNQPLFKTSVRIYTSTSSAARNLDIYQGIESSFAALSVTGLQGITAQSTFPTNIRNRINKFKFTNRLPAIFNLHRDIYSASEIAEIYHFPFGQIKTEDFSKLRSRSLPAPLSIKNNSAADVVIGLSDYDDNQHPLGLTIDQRRKHTYVIGKTGTGKTTMLMNCIYQDMVHGKGLAVFDPHGDMFRELLRIVPEHRRKDVVVFDPSDRNNPIGLNILDPGIDFQNEDDKHEWITSTVLSVFEKLADKNQWGPRMEHILRNATLTALQQPNPSLFTIQQLLTDKTFQKKVASELKDPVLKQFWNKEFKMMGSMQVSSATAPLTHRIGHFITTKMSRHILLQEKSTVRIADVMNEGKILLVNLSKGDIGEDQSVFFGTILTSFIWMAAYQRTKIPEKQRRDFFVYVDEFQNFATPRFSEITSEGRKFRVSLIVSHQNTAQIEDKSIVQIVAGNAATMVCFKTSPEDEVFVLPYMRPEVDRGNIVNLEPYHFFAKVTGNKSEDAFSGQTVQLNSKGSDEIRNEVIANSRAQYTTPLSKVEGHMDKLFSLEKTTQKQSVKSKTKPQQKSTAESKKKIYGL